MNLQAPTATDLAQIVAQLKSQQTELTRLKQLESEVARFKQLEMEVVALRQQLTLSPREIAGDASKWKHGRVLPHDGGKFPARAHGPARDVEESRCPRRGRGRGWAASSHQQRRGRQHPRKRPGVPGASGDNFILGDINSATSIDQTALINPTTTLAPALFGVDNYGDVFLDAPPAGSVTAGLFHIDNTGANPTSGNFYALYAVALRCAARVLRFTRRGDHRGVLAPIRGSSGPGKA